MLSPDFAAFAADLAHMFSVPADGFTALPADLGIKLGPVLDAGGLATLATQLRVAVMAKLAATRLATLVADFLVETAAMEGGSRLSAFPAGFFDRHLACLARRHKHLTTNAIRNSKLACVAKVPVLTEDVRQAIGASIERVYSASTTNYLDETIAISRTHPACVYCGGSSYTNIEFAWSVMKWRLAAAQSLSPQCVI